MSLIYTFRYFTDLGAGPFIVTNTLSALPTTITNAEENSITLLGEPQVISNAIFQDLENNASFNNSILANPDINSNIIFRENQLQGDSLITGNAVWTGTGLQFQVSDTEYIIDSTTYSTTTTLVTLSNAPTNSFNGRIDVIYVDIDGVDVKQGTEGPSPSKPELEVGELEITFITIADGISQPSGLSLENIYLEDDGQPAEWNTSTFTTVGTIITNSSELAFQGSNSIKFDGTDINDRVLLSVSPAFSILTIDLLEFKIYLPSELNSNSRIRVHFRKNGSRVSRNIDLQNGRYNFIRTATGQWQTISILKSDLRFTSSDVDEMRIIIKKKNDTSPPPATFFIDQIRFQQGIPSGTVSASGVSGEVNIAANVGDSGIGFFNEKVGEELQFKNLVASSNISLVDNTSTKTVDADLSSMFLSRINSIQATAKSGKDSDTILISGSANWDSGLTFDITDTEYLIEDSYYTTTATQVSLATADPTNPRIDIIYVDPEGVKVKIGTAAPTPSSPELLYNELQLSQITVAAGATDLVTSTDVTQIQIYFENTEWTTSGTGVVGGTVNFDYTTDQFAGTKSIQLVNLENEDSITLTTGTVIEKNDFDLLNLRLKLLSVLPSDKRIGFCLMNGANSASTNIFMRDGNYGLDIINTTDWQLISIPRTIFNIIGDEFDALKIKVLGTEVTTASFLLDNIQLQSGVPSPLNGGGTGASGNSLFFIIDDATSATATDNLAAGFQQYLPLIITEEIPAGDYFVIWSYNWGHEQTGQIRFEAKLEIDGGNPDLHRGQAYSAKSTSDLDSNTLAYTRFTRITFTQADTHTITISYKTLTNNKSAYISRGRIAIWRIS